jgi:mannose-6-phosphate isomerase-like protein (cupin superfamily)
VANEAAVLPKSGGEAAVKPEVISLRTQMVSQGFTRVLLAETDNSTFRIHCYGPKSGENGLHSHIDEDHVFVVLQGEAQFYDLDGALPVLKKHQALMLPKGCFYSFANETDDPLVMIRFGASDKKLPEGRLDPQVMLRFGAMEKNWKGGRLDPQGKPIAGRGHAPDTKPTVFIENAFFE